MLRVVFSYLTMAHKIITYLKDYLQGAHGESTSLVACQIYLPKNNVSSSIKEFYCSTS